MDPGSELVVLLTCVIELVFSPNVSDMLKHGRVLQVFSSGTILPHFSLSVACAGFAAEESKILCAFWPSRLAVCEPLAVLVYTFFAAKH